MNLNKFGKIITDFVNDIDLVFPENKVFEKSIYTCLHTSLLDASANDSEYETSIRDVYEYCKKVYPKHFFDLLYKNEKVFESDIYFLPDINFKGIWRDDISRETKSKIWQYLQLILIMIGFVKYNL